MPSQYKKQMNAAKQVMGELKIVFATYLVRLMNFPQHRPVIMKSMVTLLNQAKEISSALVENKQPPGSEGEASSSAALMMLMKKLRSSGNEKLAKEVEQLLQKEKQSYVMYSPEDEQEVIKESFKRFL